MAERVRVDVAGETVELLRAPAEGPSLVLVHGAGGNGETWAPTLAAWAGFDVWCPSLPGRGGSLRPAAATAAGAAEWLGHLLDAAGLQRPILLGHSFGGAVALELGLARAGTLDALVLVASGARLRVSPAILQAAAEATPARPLALDFAFGPGCAGDVVRGYADVAARTPPEAALADWHACNGFDRLEALSGLRCRTLIVHGSEDALTPPRYQRVLEERIPGARRVEVPGAGHMLPWERPEALASAVREALRGS